MAIKEVPEFHQQGTITLENGEHFADDLRDSYIKGDLGVQIAQDGRVWICINGIAFLRFSPHLNGKMQRES